MIVVVVVVENLLTPLKRGLLGARWEVGLPDLRGCGAILGCRGGLGFARYLSLPGPGLHSHKPTACT